MQPYGAGGRGEGGRQGLEDGGGWVGGLVGGGGGFTSAMVAPRSVRSPSSLSAPAPSTRAAR